MASWAAEPHTLAKIEILRKYLDAWFPIVGYGFPQLRLYYIDGFSGPGTYSGGELGSPLAALGSAVRAVEQNLSTNRWRARGIVCLFVETDTSNMESLMEALNRAPNHRYVNRKAYLGDFDTILPSIKNDFPESFGQSPLFVFLDPFGPTGLSFETVASVLNSPNSEVLLHFDADGAARMIAALKKGYNVNSHYTLTRIFGDDVWLDVLNETVNSPTEFETITRGLVTSYLRNIRKICNYAFPFQMITPPKRHQSAVGYYLIFASNHPLGLQKMKSAMKTIGQGGQYRFSNFASRQPLLFEPERSKQADADLLFRRFQGQRQITWRQIMQVILNETDLVSPRAALKHLESESMTEVLSPRPMRKRFTYPKEFADDLIFDFKKGDNHGEEVSD